MNFKASPTSELVDTLPWTVVPTKRTNQIYLESVPGSAKILSCHFPGATEVFA